MPTKAELQQTFGVVNGLFGSPHPEDASTALRWLAIMKSQIDALEEGISLRATATENPWNMAVGPGTCFGGKYVVKRRLSNTKHIYLCSCDLFRSHTDQVTIDVVVKCTFLNEHMDPATIAMIHEQEKRATKALKDASHCPYSIGLLDAGTIRAPEGAIVMYWQAFQKMECDANELRNIMGGTIPPSIVMEAAREIMEALVNYHGAGIIHRDIKPHNILVDWPQHASLKEIWKILIHFALTDAQLVTGTALDTNVTQAGTLLGTPQYMSPEQIRDPRNVTPKSDIWSLAVTLYQLTTGEFPHPTATSIGAQVYTILHEKPRLFSQHPKALGFPAFFQKLMDRSLSVDPKLRPTAWDWHVAFRTEDARMPLAFEPMPLPLLGQGSVIPPE